MISNNLDYVDKNKTIIRWSLYFSAALLCSIVISILLAWWLLPAYAPRWFGQFADEHPFLSRAIADRLFNYGYSEYMVCANMPESDRKHAKIHAINSYHPLYEATRLYEKLNEAQPQDKDLYDRLLNCRQYRYASTLAVGMDVPP